VPKDFQAEAREEATSREALLQWTQQRIENIHRHVTAHDVLRKGGVEFKQGGSDEEEQFSCPFHGVDHKPSARVYPADNRRQSHAWCFVCQEKSWDAIGLWKKFNGGEDKSFSRVLTEIEHAYGITPPPMPKEASIKHEVRNVALESFDSLYESCEHRLRGARENYRSLLDMVGYLSAGQVLDKLRHRVDKQQTTPERGKEILRQLLDRIVAKVRQCPEG
jgi:hypothetical protein